MSIILNGTTGITTPDVTSDGLTVDSTTLVVDETNNRVGIGTSSPSALLDLEGATATQHINATTGNANTLYQLNGTTTASIEVGGGNNFFLTSNHASGNIYFRTGAGAPTRATIASSGNVGIGTISPRDVAGDVSLGLNDTTGGLLDFYANGTRVGGIVGVSGNLQIGTVTATPLIFNTNTNERVRIASNGDLLVGTTTSSAKVTSSSSASGYNYASVSVGNQPDHIVFKADATTTGSITRVGGTGVAYNTSSDYRLKEDWVAVANASTRVNALKPVNFAWKVDGSRVDGFLAHEVAEVVPEAVSGEKDAMRDEEYEVTPAVEATYDEEGNELTPAIEAVMGTRTVPAYQGIDQSKLVPLLTAALQEALAKIDDLTARVVALEGQP